MSNFSDIVFEGNFIDFNLDKVRIPDYTIHPVLLLRNAVLCDLMPILLVIDRLDIRA